MRNRRLAMVAAVVGVGVMVGAGWGGGGGTPASATFRGPTATFAAPAASAPAVDKVFKAEGISLKTKGKTPREGFEMLGQAAGVPFNPYTVEGRGASFAARGPVWSVDNRSLIVDFDLENASFWQAAMRLGDAGQVLPSGDGHTLSVRAKPSIMAPVLQVQDSPALRVLLFSKPDARWTRLDLVFLVDPRLTVLEAGDLAAEAAIDTTGERLSGQATSVQMPAQYPIRSTLQQQPI